jgi:hypothetical protein
MAIDGTKISALTDSTVSGITDADAFVIERSFANKQLSHRNLRKAFAPSGTGLTKASGETLRWSAITAYSAAVDYAPGDVVASTTAYLCIQANGPNTTNGVQAVSQTAYWIDNGDDTVSGSGDYASRLLTRTTPADGDIPRWSSDTATNGGAADFVAGNPRWKTVPKSRYTASGFSNTYTLTMSNTSDFAIGLPIKFTNATSTYYAIVTGLSANTSITLSGAPLTGTLSAVYVGTPEMVHTERFMLPFIYGSSTAATAGPTYKLAASDGTASGSVPKTWHLAYQWQKSPAYLVRFGATNFATGATGPKLSPMIGTLGGTMKVISTENGNLGPSLSTTAATWVYNAAGTIDAAKYDIALGNDVEILFTAGSANQQDLLIVCTFVLG